jgi:O-antigen/teichoic acid export membrane protein
MLKYLKRLASDSIIYGLSGVIISLINLFLVPVYTRIFQPSDYGTLNLINVTFFLLNIFVTLGLDNSVALWYWDKNQLEEQKTTFSSWAWFMYAFSIIVSLPILIFPEVMNTLILKDPRYGDVLQIASINLIFSGSQKLF